MKKYLIILATLFTLGAALANTPAQSTPAPNQTLTELAKAVGLQPADYARLVVVLGESTAVAVIGLQAEFKLEKSKFRKEFRDISAALMDLVEVGVARDTAMNLLRSAIVADPSLDEVTTITARVIDLKAKGVSLSEALAIAKAEVARDRSDDDDDDDDDDNRADDDQDDKDDDSKDDDRDSDEDDD
ncbi:hypothetical protein [uncultured Meiothermus sp.]|jgi:hypothetical protein|uniref:hypothetical protein n=1 Tax=uncultured Meiothermus sp. TaxID=157471 RepID=UPI00261BECDC|nr:hypothetical protein [uncultured Meiothermus sp.]